MCSPFQSDENVAPAGQEDLFLLIPVAAGLDDNKSNREKYFDIMMRRLEDYTGTEILSDIDYKRSYCINDFKMDYNAYKGNAYGLSNTLRQAAVMKPKIKNKKIDNL